MYDTSNHLGGGQNSTITNTIAEMNNITNSSSDEHEELLAEMELIERLPTQERLKQAKRRRALQLKKWSEYEKEVLNNDQNQQTDEFNRINNTTRSSKRKKQRNNFKSTSTNGSMRSIKFQDHIVLLDAIMRKDYDEVERLLETGITPNSANEDGLTAIHQCCIDDSADLLRLLISYGANVNVCDNDLWTPLHAAATCANLEICKILIENQAELLAVNTDGNMPYDICDDEVCLEYIESEMARKGVTQQAIDMKRSETEMRMLDDLKQICLSKNSFDSSYMSEKSVLQQNNFFLYFNNTQATDGYLDLNAKDANGATLMHIACANGYTSILEFLLIDCSLAIESGSRLIAPSLSVTDNDGWTPLHVATFWGHQKAIEILLEHGADINLKTNNDETVLDLCDDPDIKDYIIQKSKEIETQQQQAALEAMQKQMQLIYNANSISNSTNSINESIKKTNGDNSSIVNNSSRSLKRTSTGVSRSSSVRRTSFRDREKAARKFDASFKEVLYASEVTVEEHLSNIIMPAKEKDSDFKNSKNLTSVVKIINNNPSNNNSNQIYDNFNNNTKSSNLNTNYNTTTASSSANHNSSNNNKNPSFIDDHNNNQLKVNSQNSSIARVHSAGSGSHHNGSNTSNLSNTTNNNKHHASTNFTQVTDTTLDNTTNSSIAVINVNNLEMNSTNNTTMNNNKSASQSSSVLRNTTSESFYYNTNIVSNTTNANKNINREIQSKTTTVQPVSTNQRSTNQPNSNNYINSNNTNTNSKNSNSKETPVTSDVEGVKYKFFSNEPIGGKNSNHNEFGDVNSDTASNKFTKCSKCLKRCFVM